MSRARKTRTDIRQEQIASAALALVARHGLNELSVGAVAREVGVVPSALYRHYASMDAVLESVLELIARRLSANVASARQATPDPLEQLHLLLQRHVQLARHHAGVPRVLFSEQIFAGNLRRRKHVHKLFQSYLGQIAGLIREGQRQEVIRADLSPATTAVMFLGLIQPAIILWLMSKGKFDVAGQAEQAWLMFRGMLDPTQKEDPTMQKGRSYVTRRKFSQNQV